MNKITVDFAEIEDLDSWMQLVYLVSWNFPGLETKELINEYRQTVIKNIKRKSALCAKDKDVVAGVLLFSVKYNMLCFLAVHPAYRRKGIATQMVKTMLNHLDENRDVAVSTFREGDKKGIAPRSLYQKLGFVPADLIEEFGYPNQRFILRRKRTANIGLDCNRDSEVV